MECDGRNIPSSNCLKINFRASNYKQEELNTLKNIQIKARNNEILRKHILKQKIYNENGAAYVYLENNLINRPLKLRNQI